MQYLQHLISVAWIAICLIEILRDVFGTSNDLHGMIILQLPFKFPLSFGLLTLSSHVASINTKSKKKMLISNSNSENDKY